MAGFSDRESKRKSVVGGIIGGTNQLDESVKEKPVWVQKSYYISPEQHKQIGILAATIGVDKSKIVRDAIDLYLHTQENTK